MLLPYFEEATFQCPEEPHTIPQAVHFARLARGFPKCRRCEHASQNHSELQSNEQYSGNHSGLTIKTNSVRGVVGYDWTNESILQVITKIVQAFSEHVADSRKNRRLSVVIGCDDRTSSLQLASPVIEQLQSIGCHVIEIGIGTKPALVFATTHLDASFGIYVTGADSPFSQTGFDIVDCHGFEWDHSCLSSIHQELSSGSRVRISRNSGESRLFNVEVPYKASFQKYFHALRPLRLHGRCFSASVAKTLEDLFRGLPCVMTTQVGNVSDDVKNSTWASSAIDLSFQISEDGTSIDFYDECDHRVSNKRITKLISDFLVQDDPEAVVTTPRCDQAGNDIGASWLDFQRRAREDRALMVTDHNGRWWFPEASHGPDAVLSLAYVLQVLSQSDKSFSNRVANSMA